MGLLEGIKQRIRGNDGLQMRLADIPNKNNEIGVSPEKDDLTNKQISSENSILDAADVEKFITLSKYRDEKYSAFEEMLSDPIVAAALEMYADDATQYNRDGNIIWAESDDPVIADAANRLIKILDIPSQAWRHIYSLCTYGDLYLRLYKEGDESDILDSSVNDSGTLKIISEDKTRRLEERIEYVSNPATVFDLQEKDKTCGFVRTKSSINTGENTAINRNYIGGEFMSHCVSTISSKDCVMLYNTAYVHIMLSESINRAPEYLAIDRGDDSNSSDIYKIKTGKSILEDAYSISRQLDLLQDSMLLSRLSKSAIIRLLQIEIGDAPKSEGENILRRVKSLVEQKMSLNTKSGRARSYNSPGPIENIIYVPTKNGKGAIEASVIGGDVDVKSIADVDYFQNLKLAALKIPKQFLNFDSPEGLGNGTSLTKVSSRYAHTVMRIQTAYIKGITNLINIFFLDRGLDYVNKFKIRMVSPATVEDSERDDQLNDRISQTGDILNLCSEYSEDVKNQILQKLVTEFIGMPDVAQMLKVDTNDSEIN